MPDYLTLSHCWGATMPLKLESSSLETHRKAIPLKYLSKTFQDAIYLVRGLGYQYIWIDSLCIIQDSEEDWQRESEFMGSIYRNSICTLAATASTSGEGGLFRLRNILRNHRCQVWGDSAHAIYIDIENDTALENYREDVGNGPLNSRAWVLQERYLSPRVIHFTANAVYWDCHEKHLCDYGHELEDKSSISFGFDDGYARPFQIDEQIWSEEFSDRWKFSVEKYSQMNLTKESDRLVAFRGVVKYYEEFTGGECVSGLWKQFFLSHLLWRVGEASLRLRCSSLASVPSWSWAIIGKPIKYAP
ncbi:heterokaryon incompatibility protein-domain-containing protein, partial [Bisporella sp. PMI_857]